MQGEDGADGAMMSTESGPASLDSASAHATETPPTLSAALGRIETITRDKQSCPGLIVASRRRRRQREEGHIVPHTYQLLNTARGPERRSGTGVPTWWNKDTVDGSRIAPQQLSAARV